MGVFEFGSCVWADFWWDPYLSSKGPNVQNSAHLESGYPGFDQKTRFCVLLDTYCVSLSFFHFLRFKKYCKPSQAFHRNNLSLQTL